MQESCLTVKVLESVQIKRVYGQRFAWLFLKTRKP